MADNETTHFATMGEFPLEDFINVSGQRSGYTQPVQKKGPGAQDSMDGPGGGRGRGPVLKEGNGPHFAVQTQICYTNDPVAHGTGRGMRKVASAVGNRDFWDDRASQSGQTIVP
jgi:hypothetical protein